MTDRETEVWNHKYTQLHLQSDDPAQRAFGRAIEALYGHIEDWLREEMRTGLSPADLGHAWTCLYCDILANIAAFTPATGKQATQYLFCRMATIPEGFCNAFNVLRACQTADQNPTPETLAAVDLPDYLKPEGK